MFQKLMVKLDQNRKQMKRKRYTYDSVNALYEGIAFVLNSFKSEIFPLNLTQEKESKC